MLKNTKIEKTDSISPCFVGFENPCFEHRHWKFEWAAASLRGTRPAWRACLTLGRRQASPGTRPAATSLPNPWGGGKPTRHEASMASLPNPWGGGKPTWHEASVASLPSPFLYFVFQLYYYMHHHSYIHHPIVYTCIIIVHHHTYIHTCISPLYISITHLHASYIHTYIHTYIHHSSNLRLNAAEVIDVQWRVKIKNRNNSHHHRQLSLPPSLSLSP